MEMVSDEDLMGRVSRNGDRDAASELIARYKERAYLFALKLLGNSDDALDASQEAFVKVFVKRSRYEQGRLFRPWFLAILRNCARDIQRSTLRMRKAGGDELVTYMADAKADPLTAARSAQVWRKVLQLPPKLREVIVLRHFEGLDYKEMAEVLGVPINTVASRLHQARKKMVDDDEL